MSNNPTTMTVPNNNPYLHASPAPPPSSKNTLNNLSKKFDSAAKKAESFAGNLFNHLRTGPGFVDVAMTRLEQAGRVLSDGGCHNIFKREFGDVSGEKLKKTFVCYLSTTNGPVLGTLYVSNMRIGFRSDNPVWNGPGGGPGMGQWVYYKVVVLVDQVLAVNPSGNPVKPGQKYVKVVVVQFHNQVL
ncbi:GEM-like protein 1 [Bienertia sinuspersici]